jgi:O-antigen/teichoic acid export membrane protein
MSVLRRLLGETTIYGLSAAVTSAIGFVQLPIYTRAFTPSQYGALAQINATSTLAMVLIVFGLDNSSAVWYWDHPSFEERSRTFSTWYVFTLVSAAVLAAVAFLLRVPLARTVLRDEGMAPLWTLFALNLLTTNLARIGAIWFRMEHKPLPSVGLTAVPALVTAAVGIYLVTQTSLGLSGAVIGQIVGSWVGALVTVAVLLPLLSIGNFDRSRLWLMLKFSAPLVLMTKLNWLLGSAITYFVNLLCSREDAGLYQVGASIASVISLAMFAFAQAWAPSALAIREDAEARKVYGIAVEAAGALGLLMAVGLGVAAEPLLLLVTRPAYVAARWVLALLALNTVVMNVPAILSVTFARTKSTAPLAKATAAGTAVTMGLLPFLIHGMGKEGAALSVVLGSLTILAYSLRESQRVFPIDIRLPRLATAAALAAATEVAGLALRSVLPTAGAMLGGAILVTLALAVILGFLYRRPLATAVAELRAARSASA